MERLQAELGYNELVNNGVSAEDVFKKYVTANKIKSMVIVGLTSCIFIMLFVCLIVLSNYTLSPKSF